MFNFLTRNFPSYNFLPSIQKQTLPPILNPDIFKTNSQLLYYDNDYCF